MKAYEVVVYLTNHKEEPIILTSKARVASLISKTLPQLKLTAMYIASHYSKHIREILSHIEN